MGSPTSKPGLIIPALNVDNLRLDPIRLPEPNHSPGILTAFLGPDPGQPGETLDLVLFFVKFAFFGQSLVDKYPSPAIVQELAWVSNILASPHCRLAHDDNEISVEEVCKLPNDDKCGQVELFVNYCFGDGVGGQVEAVQARGTIREVQMGGSHEQVAQDCRRVGGQAGRGGVREG